MAIHQPCPWYSPGKNTGVGCHFLLQCMKVKSESEVAQSCPTSSDPMDCSLPGSSIHGIFQARVLESALLTTPRLLILDHSKLWKILKEMGIPDHLTYLLRNLYAGQEETVRTGHGTTDWLQIGKGVWQPSSTLAWRIPRMGEPGGLTSMGSHRVGHN